MDYLDLNFFSTFFFRMSRDRGRAQDGLLDEAAVPHVPALQAGIRVGRGADQVPQDQGLPQQLPLVHLHPKEVKFKEV